MDYPWPDEFEGFVELLRRSGLATERAVGELVERYRKNYLPATRLPDTVTAFCSFLVAENVLTTWQCTKLRECRYKGSRVGHWLFLDELGGRTKERLFFARDERGLGHAILKVIPQDGPVPVRFEVVQRFG